MNTSYYSNGKLLLTGEYAILDGATGLAVPTKFGQWLHVNVANNNQLQWTSLDHNDKPWFTAKYSLPELQITESNDEAKATTLQKILKAVRLQKSSFLNDLKTGYTVETKLSFPTDWGLGSSSTLINNIAQWANIDAFNLLGQTLGGSGYDLACAQHMTPILYHLDLGNPQVFPTAFKPEFADRLYFIHLNQKQNSREAIATYRSKVFNKQALLEQINHITQQMLEASSLELFESLLIEHEMALSEILEIAPLKRKFPDYFGALKSLGAWGGDFILATGNEKTPDYFKAKGFTTVLSYEEMVL
ncbi:MULTISPECIES: GYDIA family GHMP kinase [Flavobacteriaceae]|uniref:GYDIA family GHMP kinase n=1 Tax=Flavobacteriaceae TaxID=49546 RepID=UPI0010AEB9AB|nr:MULTISPECIES: GYDIA family GHMP kinase [Flavobacteriaceae]NJB36683.1 GHMP kinase [Croceivirga sp. JEA036]TKD60975.1 GHMP kinase [Flavobacterium sp. ASW18X]